MSPFNPRPRDRASAGYRTTGDTHAISETRTSRTNRRRDRCEPRGSRRTQPEHWRL